jgi:hypothetical protein
MKFPSSITLLHFLRPCCCTVVHTTSHRTLLVDVIKHPSIRSFVSKGPTDQHDKLSTDSCMHNRSIHACMHARTRPGVRACDVRDAQGQVRSRSIDRSTKLQSNEPKLPNVPSRHVRRWFLTFQIVPLRPRSHLLRRGSQGRPSTRTDNPWTDYLSVGGEIHI